MRCHVHLPVAERTQRNASLGLRRWVVGATILVLDDLEDGAIWHLRAMLAICPVMGQRLSHVLDQKMKVLVGCEFSGVVRDAFIRRGHDAVSCDLLPTESPYNGRHYEGNVFDLLRPGIVWDLAIFHPPCTRLCVSGARWWKEHEEEQEEAIAFVLKLMSAPVERIALENPIGILSTCYRKPDQIIQPWMFGHGETKATCLWLKNLPPLEPTDIVEGRDNRIHRMPPGPDRGKERSRTYQGIADAMADQWGNG